MSLPTAVLLCPGRGSYGRDELGSIARWLQPGAVADALASFRMRLTSSTLPGLSTSGERPAKSPRRSVT